MRVERGLSQILFGMLPSQTVDLKGGVWRVVQWTNAVRLDLDQNTVRNAIIESSMPWAINDEDGGLVSDLRGNVTLEIVGVNPERGVLVEPFPRQWRCRSCNRISRERLERCVCGSSAQAQMHFVAYHTCGAVREPYLPRCREHGSVAVRLPGTMTARELFFYCPDCNQPLSQGFPYQPCECGNGAMSITVHRAGIVYSPQYTIVVNPPDPGVAARIRATGGGIRALEWLLDGMGGDGPSGSSQSLEGLVDTLVQQGISLETARLLAEEARRRGDVTKASAEGDFDFPEATRHRAQEEALSLWSAITGGRVRLSDLIEDAEPPLKNLYEISYQRAVRDALLETVDLLTNFPVATLSFGFTRGGMTPGQTRLVAFRERGAVRAYGTLARTEALLFQLDPLIICNYLINQGFQLDEFNSKREARLSILKAAVIPSPTDENPQPLGEALITVLHSYAHRLLRIIATNAGIEQAALAEYLLPHHLCFIIYSSARGEFVLGGLQAVYETSLDKVLDDFVRGETRCPLDPGCQSGGGACMACLHLGEPSCRLFNRFLNRASLTGHSGLLRINR